MDNIIIDQEQNNSNEKKDKIEEKEDKIEEKEELHNQAILKLIHGVMNAQKRGAFSLEEAYELYNAVKLFIK